MAKVYTTKEAAKFLNVSDARIRQLAIAGELHGTKVPADDVFRGSWFFEEEDLLNYQMRKAGVDGSI